MKPKILDRFENEIGILPDCIEGIAIEERNGMCEAEITYPIFSPNWQEIKRGNIVSVDINETLKNQKCRIYKVTKPLNGKIKLYARHIFFDLGRDLVEKFSLPNASCEYALNELLRRSQFSQGFTGYSDIINAQDYSMNTINLLKAIGGAQGSILDTYGTGAEILRDNKKIYVYNKRGRDNGVSIEYAKNMTGLNIEFDDSSLVTRIKAIAKYTDENNNEIIVSSNPKYVDSPLMNNYETPFITEIDFSGEFENNEIPTREKLKELADKYFRINKCDQLKINIKVEFIPLSKCVGYSDIQDKISLCDTVTIRDKRYNLDTQAKVIKTYYNFLTDRYEKMELGDPKVSLGDLVGGGKPGIEGEVGSKAPGINDNSFPDTLPRIPVLKDKLYGFDTIELSWTFENKTYYTYELYASKVKDFIPNTFDLLFKGNASTFLHSAKPSEIWYYKIRAINTHGRATEFSNQVVVETVKIENLEHYVANAAIGDALIGELNLGRGWFGQLQGNYIDAKHLTVTDGNGKLTLDVDSYGNITLLPTYFRMLVNGEEESLVTESIFEADMSGIRTEVSKKTDYWDVKSVIEQNPDSVQVGFNNINDTFAVTPHEVYMKDLNNQKHLRFFDGKIKVLHQNGRDIGFLGRNFWNGTDIYGMSVGMDTNTSFSVGFSNGSSYISMLACCKKQINSNGITLNPGVTLGGDLYLNKFKLKDVYEIHGGGTWSDGGKFVRFEGDIDARGYQIFANNVKSILTTKDNVERKIDTTQAIIPNVEYIGNSRVFENEIRIDIPYDLLGFDNYFISLSGIGGTVTLKEKTKEYFVVTGDNIEFDYLIKASNSARKHYKSNESMLEKFKDEVKIEHDEIEIGVEENNKFQKIYYKMEVINEKYR